MQKKCRRCGDTFTVRTHEDYCPECEKVMTPPGAGVSKELTCEGCGATFIHKKEKAQGRWPKYCPECLPKYSKVPKKKKEVDVTLANMAAKRKEKATAYLQDIKMIAIRIQSLRQDIRKLQYDIITLSAIDYSKDRVSGGSTPAGLEGDVARLIDTVDTKKREIAKLIAKREEARALIEKIECIPGRIILSQEYINGAFPKKVQAMIYYEKSSYFNLKNKALNELGELLS